MHLKLHLKLLCCKQSGASAGTDCVQTRKDHTQINDGNVRVKGAVVYTTENVKLAYGPYNFKNKAGFQVNIWVGL